MKQCCIFLSLNNHSTSFGSPPSHLWTLQIQTGPWDCSSSPKNVFFSVSFHTSWYSTRKQKSCLTDLVFFKLPVFLVSSHYFEPKDEALDPPGSLMLSWMFYHLGRCSVFAQDLIVLDLTMQYIFCPWLCQAPWGLVSSSFLTFFFFFLNLAL